MKSFEQVRQRMHYVPAEFREEHTALYFDNQRDFFRTLWTLVNEKEGEKVSQYSWVDFHVNTIDTLLFGLARYGYVLAKSRKKFNFFNYREYSRKVQNRTSNLLFNALVSNKEGANAIKETSEDNLSIIIPEDILQWIQSEGHLPEEFKGSENFILMITFLLRSISSYEDPYREKKLTLEDRFLMSKLFFNYAAQFGYVLKRKNKDGDFEDLPKLIEPYREGYNKMMEKINSQVE